MKVVVIAKSLVINYRERQRVRTCQSEEQIAKWRSEPVDMALLARSPAYGKTAEEMTYEELLIARAHLLAEIQRIGPYAE